MYALSATAPVPQSLEQRWAPTQNHLQKFAYWGREHSSLALGREEAVLVPSVHWGVERGQQGESNKVHAQTRVLILRKAHSGAAMRSLKLS